MNLSFYNIDINYCEFLRKYDKNVPFTTDNKENRPFIGIILKINDITYYAPLTSPKEKHLTMNNQIDFIKIDNGKLGAINLNNMIPVNKENIKKINFNLITNSQYKELLIDQLNWCNKPKNKDTIINRASRLYKFLYTNNSNKLKNRCCDFKKLEEISKLYNKNLHKANENIENKKTSIKDRIKDKQNIINQNKENMNCQKFQKINNITNKKHK